MTLSSIELIFDFSVMNLLTPLNDQERIFSLQYKCNIKQTSDENKE